MQCLITVVLTYTFAVFIVCFPPLFLIWTLSLAVLLNLIVLLQNFLPSFLERHSKLITAKCSESLYFHGNDNKLYKYSHNEIEAMLPPKHRQRPIRINTHTQTNIRHSEGDPAAIILRSRLTSLMQTDVFIPSTKTKWEKYKMYSDLIIDLETNKC